MKAFFRRAFWTFGVLAALMVVFHTIENWRGRRAWEAWKATQSARGVSYAWSDILPPAVSDAENFAKAPILADAMLDLEHAKGIEGIRLAGAPSEIRSWRNGESEDLKAWAEALNVTDVRVAIAGMKTPLDAIVEATHRPGCRLAVDYSKQEIPALLGLRQAAKALKLRAICRLRDGDRDGAIEDTLAILRMAEHFRLEPQLITQLLRNGLLLIGMQVVWEGLEARSWRDSDLQRLQELLAKVDLLDGVQRMFNGERMFNFGTFGAMPAVRPWGAKGGSGSVSTGGLLFPSGWYLRNHMAFERYFLDSVVFAVDPKKHRAYPEKHQAAIQAMESERTGPYNFFAKISGPALLSQFLRCVNRQSEIDQALVVCGLERYRLAKKSLPEQLSSLVPTYLKQLPPDLVTGEALHFDANPQGHFRLWSVGWDLKDDGGTIRKTEGRIDYRSGDWVWPAAGKSPAR